MKDLLDDKVLLEADANNKIGPYCENKYQNTFNVLNKKFFWILLAGWRVVSIFLLAKTHSLQADEFGQGTEMVYHRVYGTVSYKYIPWEWKEDALRSVLYLEFFAIPLRIIKILCMDFNIIVRYYIYFV